MDTFKDKKNFDDMIERGHAVACLGQGRQELTQCWD